MKRILIVEDEPELQELLCAYLQDAGYAAAVAGDGAAALDLFRAQSFDLVLLDIMLPKIDGFGVCAQIRRQSQVPILMLTALDGETQQLRGFGLNIDDYVTKPFSMPVLLEKIRVILRRSGEAAESRLHYRDLVVDLDTREAALDGRPLDLTAADLGGTDPGQCGPDHLEGRQPRGAHRPGVRAAAHLSGRAGAGLHPGDAALQAVGLRLLRG